jgi:hypothetical protein
MAKQKATHNGTCQWCGARQAVDPVTGTLAKHGYTVRWGFFSGVCRGSDHQPFEKSSDLIARSITETTAAAAHTRLVATETRNRTEAEPVWVSHYKAATWTDKTSGHRWAEVAITDCKVQERTYDWGTSFDVEVANPYRETMVNNRPTEVCRGYIVHADQPAQRTWWQAANDRRANAFEGTAVKMDEYVAWQTERVANWKEADLLPRK